MQVNIIDICIKKSCAHVIDDVIYGCGQDPLKTTQEAKLHFIVLNNNFPSNSLQCCVCLYV